jgi:hypothetical protein
VQTLSYHSTISPVFEPDTGQDSAARYRWDRRTTHAEPTQLHAKLSEALPDWCAIELLVNTYFDRVHWFLLVFHQDDFRARLELYLNKTPGERDSRPEALGFLSSLLAVLCIGFEYVGPYRKGLLETYGISCRDAQSRIESTFNDCFLSITSLGTLEATQTCVLLGTFYLYHGVPNTAWVVCGSGLRIAQELGLHRKWPPESSNEQLASPEVLHQIEARKRCWWAVYEIETFCSMLHGYSPTIVDDACDVAHLGPYSLEDMSTVLDSTLPTEALLVYKQMTLKLSVLIKNALLQLYGPRTLRTDEINSASGSVERQLITRVRDMDR